MKITTPEGVLTIDDDRLTFAPVDNGPVLEVSLDPMPAYVYQRGVYGRGTLSVGDHVIQLFNEQASTVVEELRRPRNVKAARKPEHRTDADTGRSSEQHR